MSAPVPASPAASVIDRAADQLSRARLKSFGRPAMIGPDADNATAVTAVVGAVSREDARLIRGGIVEPLQATARWRKETGVVPRTGWFFQWQGRWYRIAQIFDHANDPEHKVGLVDLTRGSGTGGGAI